MAIKGQSNTMHVERKEKKHKISTNNSEHKSNNNTRTIEFIHYDFYQRVDFQLVEMVVKMNAHTYISIDFEWAYITAADSLAILRYFSAQCRRCDNVVCVQTIQIIKVK